MMMTNSNASLSEAMEEFGVFLGCSKDDLKEAILEALEVPSPLLKFGILVKPKDAYAEYRKLLPWWRRKLWPWLTKLEKQKAIFNKVVSMENKL